MDFSPPHPTDHHANRLYRRYSSDAPAPATPPQKRGMGIPAHVPESATTATTPSSPIQKKVLSLSPFPRRATCFSKNAENAHKPHPECSTSNVPQAGAWHPSGPLPSKSPHATTATTPDCQRNQHEKSKPAKTRQPSCAPLDASAQTTAPLDCIVPS